MAEVSGAASGAGVRALTLLEQDQGESRCGHSLNFFYWPFVKQIIDLPGDPSSNSFVSVELRNGALQGLSTLARILPPPPGVSRLVP